MAGYLKRFLLPLQLCCSQTYRYAEQAFWLLLFLLVSYWPLHTSFTPKCSLEVEVAHVARIGLNKFLTAFDVIAHEHAHDVFS